MKTRFTPATPRENAIAGTLFVLAILLGVFPYQTVLRYMDKTVSRQVQDLADWTQRLEEPDGIGPVAQTIEAKKQKRALREGRILLNRQLQEASENSALDSQAIKGVRAPVLEEWVAQYGEESDSP